MGRLCEGFEILCTDYDHILKKRGIVFMRGHYMRILFKKIRYVCYIVAHCTKYVSFFPFKKLDELQQFLWKSRPNDERWGLEAPSPAVERSLKKPCHPNCCIQSARCHKALFCLLVGEKGESFSDLNEAEKSKARLVLAPSLWFSPRWNILRK